MASQYFTVSPGSKPDPQVKDVQRMLNIIRTRYNMNWEYLSEDGIYGKDTARAVKSFQVHKGIVPASGMLGPTTLGYIRDLYGTVPMIKAASEDLKPYHDTAGLADRFIVVKIADMIAGYVEGINGLIEEEIQYVARHGKLDTSVLKSRYYSFVTRNDSNMRELKKMIRDADTPGYKTRKRSTVKKARKAMAELTAELKRFDPLDILKRYDIPGRVGKYLKNKGIVSGMDIKTLKNNPILKQVTGSRLLTVFGMKDIMLDLCSVDEWGTEEWKARLSEHFFDFLDGLVIGYASAVIAQIVVGLVGTAVLSAGWIMVIVALVAVAIAAGLSFLMDEADVSFSKKAAEGYSAILGHIWLT